jgi:hypothetical protein
MLGWSYYYQGLTYPVSNLLLQFFEGTIFRCLTSSSKEAKISTFTVSVPNNA